MFDIDELLERIKGISDRIESLHPEDPERVTLEAERELLRADARTSVGPGVSAEYLRYELNHLRRRLGELDGEAIEKPSAARNPMALVDHQAFSRRINELLAEKTEDERTFLERRIAQLERQLDDIDRNTS